MKIYTRKGDDGSTGLLFGGRVPKNAPQPMAYGAVDEAQAFVGLARAELIRGSAFDAMLTHIERDLWVLMSELASAPENRSKLSPGESLVTADMVAHVEHLIDDVSDRFDPPTEFVVPGQNRISAAPADSQALPYLNRLSDLLWTLARWQEGGALTTRSVPNV
jgi:cob(I)alamin adenosyltransferase